MKKLTEIIQPFLNAQDTCDDVISYFKKETQPIGNYIELAHYFKNTEYGHPTKTDIAYREWLDDIIINEKYNDSIVVKGLRRKYKSKEELYNFIFLKNDQDLKLNQKWHFFISYWGLREFVTKFPQKNYDRISPLTITDDGKDYIAFRNNRSNPFTRCTEGKIWYEAYRN